MPAGLRRASQPSSADSWSIPARSAVARMAPQGGRVVRGSGDMTPPGSSRAAPGNWEGRPLVRHEQTQTPDAVSHSGAMTQAVPPRRIDAPRPKLSGAGCADPYACSQVAVALCHGQRDCPRCQGNPRLAALVEVDSNGSAALAPRVYPKGMRVESEQPSTVGLANRVALARWRDGVPFRAVIGVAVAAPGAVATAWRTPGRRA